MMNKRLRGPGAGGALAAGVPCLAGVRFRSEVPLDAGVMRFWAGAMLFWAAAAALLSCTDGGRGGGGGGGLRVAAAGNFSTAMKQILGDYLTDAAVPAEAVFASTGKLYAQIVSGAPYDVFFSADTEHVRLLAEAGIGRKDSIFIYGTGRLVLWDGRSTGENSGTGDDRSTGDSRDRDNGRDGLGGSHANAPLAALQAGDFDYLAIANPLLAPYGRAAEEALRGLGYWSSIQDKLVLGESVDQAFQFVHSGSAQLGFAAMSQFIHPAARQGDRQNDRRGGPRSALQITTNTKHWVVPQELYAPIRQAAVILNDTTAARDFMDFVRSQRGRQIIAENGY